MWTINLRVTLISVGLLLATAGMAAPGDHEFKQGVSAFRTGNYRQAIAAFKRAQQKGKRSSALTYNLGVSYYKTKQYTKAEQHFSELLNDRQFQQLAQYNLGLVNLAQQRKQAALVHFRLAADKHGDPKVTALARRMLDKYTPHKTRHRASGLLSLGYGHDSNVTLASTGAPTQQSDNYIELFGFISVPTGPVVLNASLFQQDYRNVNSADFMQLSAGVSYPFQAKNWNLAPALYLIKDKLNSNDFLTITDIRLSARRSLAAHSQLLLRYRYSDISADSTAYNYLQGSRQQVRVQHTSLTHLGQLRLRYELELNARQNLATANYSPTRNTLLVRLKQKLAHDWQAKEELSWRDSRYGAAAGVTRKDTRYQLRLSADTKFARDWRAGLRYSHTKNNSNLANEDYTRNDAQVYVNWLF